MADDAPDELPKTVIHRIVKAQLPPGFQVSKEAKDALARAALIFVCYLSHTANDLKVKGTVVSADDILKAVEEIEFTMFLPGLRDTLAHWRKLQADKKLTASAAAALVSSGGAAGGDDDDDAGGDEEMRDAAD